MNGRLSNREVGCARNGEVSGSKCEKRRECGGMGIVKKEGRCKRNRESVKKEEQKPFKQFLCTAHL